MKHVGVSNHKFLFNLFAKLSCFQQQSLCDSVKCFYFRLHYFPTITTKDCASETRMHPVSKYSWVLFFRSKTKSLTSAPEQNSVFIIKNKVFRLLTDFKNLRWLFESPMNEILYGLAGAAHDATYSIRICDHTQQGPSELCEMQMCHSTGNQTFVYKANKSRHVFLTYAKNALFSSSVCGNAVLIRPSQEVEQMLPWHPSGPRAPALPPTARCSTQDTPHSQPPHSEGASPTKRRAGHQKAAWTPTSWRWDSGGISGGPSGFIRGVSSLFQHSARFVMISHAHPFEKQTPMTETHRHDVSRRGPEPNNGFQICWMFFFGCFFFKRDTNCAELWCPDIFTVCPLSL